MLGGCCVIIFLVYLTLRFKHTYRFSWIRKLRILVLSILMFRPSRRLRSHVEFFCVQTVSRAHPAPNQWVPWGSFLCGDYGDVGYYLADAKELAASSIMMAMLMEAVLNSTPEDLLASIIWVMLMKAMSSSETSVTINEIAGCYVPHDSHLHVASSIVSSRNHTVVVLCREWSSLEVDALWSGEWRHPESESCPQNSGRRREVAGWGTCSSYGS